MNSIMFLSVISISEKITNGQAEYLFSLMPCKIQESYQTVLSMPSAGYATKSVLLFDRHYTDLT